MTTENSWQDSGLDTYWLNRSSQLLTVQPRTVSLFKTPLPPATLQSPWRWAVLHIGYSVSKRVRRNAESY
jgi:hypothetical protein